MEAATLQAVDEVAETPEGLTAETLPGDETVAETPAITADLPETPDAQTPDPADEGETALRSDDRTLAERPAEPDHDEREEIPVFDQTDWDVAVDLPDEGGYESLVSDPVTSSPQKLAEYLFENGISPDSEAGQALLMEMVMLNGSNFNANILDLDGNRLLTDVDLAYVHNNWGMTAFGTCRLDNAYHRYQVYLEPWPSV